MGPSYEELFIMVGLPRSGKSTFAQELSRVNGGAPIVSADAVRRALHGHRFISKMEPQVHQMVYSMVEALFRAGHRKIIVDECHVSQKRRAVWDEMCLRVVPVIMRVAMWKCIDRAHHEGDEEIKPVIERMAGNWEEAGLETNCIDVYGHPSGGFLFSDRRNEEEFAASTVSQSDCEQVVGGPDAPLPGDFMKAHIPARPETELGYHKRWYCPECGWIWEEQPRGSLCGRCRAEIKSMIAMQVK